MPAAMNGSPLPKVRGKLGNAYCDMLLDSGSSISLVNEKVIQDRFPMVAKPKVEVLGFLQKLGMAHLSISQSTANVESEFSYVD